jgi:hypothetical protein
MCSKAVSTPIGCSDENIIAISRKNIFQRLDPKLCISDHTRGFPITVYVKDVKPIYWFDLCNDEQPDVAVEAFLKLLLLVTDMHATIKKLKQIPMETL